MQARECRVGRAFRRTTSEVGPRLVLERLERERTLPEIQDFNCNIS